MPCRLCCGDSEADVFTVFNCVFMAIVRGWVLLLLTAVVVASAALGSALFLTSSAAPLYERTNTIQIRPTGVDTYVQSSALIALTPQQRPAIAVEYFRVDESDRYRDGVSQQRIENLSLEIYELIPEEVLASLSYTVEKVDGYDRVMNVNYQPEPGRLLTTVEKEWYTSGEEIVLPIQGSGSWLVRAVVDGALYNDTVVQVSAIGSVAKEGDGELITWTQNVLSGKRVSEGFVELYSLKDTPTQIASKAVGVDGIATLPLEERGDVALVRSVVGDYAIVPLNIPEGYYSYGYEQFAPAAARLRYYLFSDRPLYQPGDTLYYKAIVRNDDDAVYSVPSGVAAVKIYRDWNREAPLYEKTHALDENGSLAGSFALPEVSAPGYYQIEVAEPAAGIDQESWLRTVSEFQVELYRKPEYFLDSSVASVEVLERESLAFTVEGGYFFGQPLSNQDVTVTASARRMNTGPVTAKEDVLRSALYEGWSRGPDLKQATATLDVSGRATVVFNTDEFPAAEYGKETGRPYVVTLEARYNDESGNLARTAANVLVWPAALYISLGEGGWYNGVVGAMKTYDLQLRPHRPSQTVRDVEVRITPKRTWWERYERSNTDSDRKYGRYRYEQKEMMLDPVTLRSNEEGVAAYQFVPREPGSYTFTVEAKDSAGRVVRQQFYSWVSSYAQVSYREPSGQGEGLAVSIAPDRQTPYRSGETAQLTLTSEIAGRDVLLTTERKTVRRYQVVNIPETATTIPFPLLATDVPNVFVSVSGFGPGGYGAATEKIALDTTEKEIDVSLSFNQETFAPGETIQVALTTRSALDGSPVSADVALWSVDKALYELSTDWREPIMDFFWRERYNETSVAHSLQGIASTGGAEKGCFASGTQVLIPGGGTKQIEDFVVGDDVLTRTIDGLLVPAKVTAVMSHEVDGYLIINDDLKVTPEHKLWVNAAWATAGTIQVGDYLVDAAGEPVTVTSIAWQRGQFTVYNLTVAEEHTYIAEGVWVHNDKGGSERDTFTDVAYWNPHVVTGSDGTAVVTFTLPDNLTTWVVNAVAANNRTQVGEVAAEFVVTKPVIVRPILPNYLRTGDTLSLSSLVYNYTGKDQEFDVMCRVGDRESKQLWRVANGAFTQLVTEPLEYSEPEMTSFRCAATAMETKERDEVTLPLTVQRYGFVETNGFAAIGNASYTIALPSDLSAQESLLEVMVSASVFGTLPQAMRYLIDYPYGCVEQTTSRFVPAVLAQENQALFAEFIVNEDLDKIINAGIARLVELKGVEAGWSWWSEETVHPLVTAYVTEYLLRAQKLGYDVPAHVLSQVERYAQDLGTDTWQPTVSAGITETEIAIARLYLLGLFGIKTDTPLPPLTPTLGPDLIALGIIAKAMHDMPVAADVEVLASLGTPFGEGLRWEAGSKQFFGSSDASTALALRAFVAAGDEVRARQAVLTLSRDRSSYYWSNTFATAQAIEALTAFTRTHTVAEAGSVPFAVSLDGIVVQQGVLPDLFAARSIQIPLPAVASGTLEIAIESPSDTPLYSTTRFAAYRTSRDLLAEDHGVKVYRTYNGNFVPGETVTVSLVVAGIPQEGEALVLEDFLPAGLVPVNTRLKNARFERSEDNGYGLNEEFKADGVVVALQWWKGEVVQYQYKARVVSRGEFTAPPAVASLMYRPEVYGRSQTHGVRVSDDIALAGVFFNSDPNHLITLPAVRLNELMKGDEASSRTVFYLIGIFLITVVLIAVATALAVRKRRNALAGTDTANTKTAEHVPPPPPSV